MSDQPTHRGGRPPGSKSHNNDNLSKPCDCPRRQKSKCRHSWFFNFRYDGTDYRFGLHKFLNKPRGYWMSRTEAEGHRDGLKARIRAGEFTDPKAAPTPASTDARLTFADVVVCENSAQRVTRPRGSRT